MKILIIKPTALGDVAMTTLLVPRIKEVYPDCHLTWLVDKPYKFLIEQCQGIDDIILSDFKGWRTLKAIPEIFSWRKDVKNKKFDVVLDLQCLARSGLICKSTKAKRRIGLASAREGSSLAYNEVVEDKAVHAVDRYAQAIAYLCKEDPLTDKQFYALEAPDGDLPEGFVKEDYIVIICV